MAKHAKKKQRSPVLGQVKMEEAKESLPVKWWNIPWIVFFQAFVIAAAVLWIYWPSLHGDWLWDDDIDITNNPVTQSPTGLWSIWFEPGSQLDYYPIKASVQWFQWHLWGMNTLGYHLTNVVLHILGSLLVWRLLDKFGLRVAWLGGLLFAIHPAQVESVAWITELKNTLSLPPFLLAMCAWIDYEEKKQKTDYLLALGLFLVSMLCKPTMVMFPVAILLFAWWKRSRIGWGDITASAPFGLISLVLGLTAIWVGQEYHQRHHTEPDMIPLGGIFSRLSCVGLSFSFYLSKCFFPAALMPIYPQWTVNPPSLWQFLPWLVLGGVIYWLWTKRHDWGRHVLLGLGFFLLFLTPFSGLLAVSFMRFAWVMDHFLYIPIIGLIGLVAAGLDNLGKRLSVIRFHSMGVVFMLLVLLAMLSRNYAAKFIDSETLWTYATQMNPHAWLAQNDLGKALFEQGRRSEGVYHMEESLRLNPTYIKGHYNLGTAFLTRGQNEEAIGQFEETLRLDPDYTDASSNLGVALLNLGRAPEAAAQFIQVLRKNNNNAIAHNNLGMALAQMHQISAAMEQDEEALQLQPDLEQARNNLARLQELQRTRPAKP